MIRAGDAVAATAGPYAGRIGKVTRKQTETDGRVLYTVRVPNRGRVQGCTYTCGGASLQVQEPLPDQEEGTEKELSARTTQGHRIEALEGLVCELAIMLLENTPSPQGDVGRPSRERLREVVRTCRTK